MPPPSASVRAARSAGLLLVLGLVAGAVVWSSLGAGTPRDQGCAVSLALAEELLPGSGPITVQNQPSQCLFSRGSEWSIATRSFDSDAALAEHKAGLRREAVPVTGLGDEAYFASTPKVGQLYAYRGKVFALAMGPAGEGTLRPIVERLLVAVAAGDVSR